MHTPSANRPTPRKRLLDLVTQERKNTAHLLAVIAEVDRRHLYESFGYSSMLDFCVERYGMNEGEAEERIEAARVALRFPLLFHAIADGRLHLAAVRLLAPYLTAENLADLVAAMTHRPESEIQAMLAEWFPDSRAV